jgi:hypothetical protein
MLVLRSPHLGSRSSKLGVAPSRPAWTFGPVQDPDGCRFLSGPPRSHCAIDGSLEGQADDRGIRQSAVSARRGDVIRCRSFTMNVLEFALAAYRPAAILRCMSAATCCSITRKVTLGSTSPQTSSWHSAYPRSRCADAPRGARGSRAPRCQGAPPRRDRRNRAATARRGEPAPPWGDRGPSRRLIAASSNLPPQFPTFPFWKGDHRSSRRTLQTGHII